MIFTKELRTEGELSVIYDKVIDYFKSLNFNLKSNVKPTRAIFQRGSVLFADVGLFRDRFETKKCELEVNLTKEAQNVVIRCDYYVPWIISSKGRDSEEIAKELKGLETFITIEKNFCPNCGTEIFGSPLYCSRCGTALKSE
ncbi:MAG: zinc ribbon domain-containing protein [Candidatus Thermoplasmatota archaeon]